MESQLERIKTLYKKGELSKKDFIDTMHGLHAALFSYALFLKGTDISKIEIIDENVILTSRKTDYHNGGIRFYCDALDNRIAPIEALNFGSYEVEDSKMMYRLIESDYTVFDIGGNIGWYTNHIAAMLEKGKIYAFEPIPETFDKLEKNTILNSFNNVSLNNLAFSANQERLTFYYSPLMPYAASAANITGSTQIQRVECVTNTIDNFVSEQGIGRIDFIKCDVEGAELFVFRGGLKTIEMHKPIVFTEMLRKWAAKFDYHPNDIISLFANLGYECFVTRDDRLVPIELVDENTIETNFFLLHKEAHKKKIASLKA